MVRPALSLALALAGIACVAGPDSSHGGGGGKADDPDSQESRVAEKMEALRGDPAALADFLAPMPKGGDLHSHLSGAVATEDLIRWGAADGLCLKSSDLSAVTCSSANNTKLSTVAEGGDLWNRIVGVWSMEGFTEEPMLDRHQHFFDTFMKFQAVTLRRSADMIVAARRKAADQHVAYLELMLSLGSSTGGRVAQKYLQPGGAWDDETLAAARDQILADTDTTDAIASNRAKLDQWEAAADDALGCGTESPEPACKVTVRYLLQAVRIQPREQVFGQFVYGFALVAADSRVVGVNLVQAEEHPTSLQYYDDDMTALDFLHRTTEPRVHVSLHAGELVPEIVSPEYLKDHIRKAVELGHAERIGHGVDLLGEDGADMLREEMAGGGVTLEACLTSNQQLLGVEGDRHSFGAYLASGIPVALATDDEGVLRSSMTAEFVRAVTIQGVSYPTLKVLAKTSLTGSFLPEEERSALLDELAREVNAFEESVVSE